MSDFLGPALNTAALMTLFALSNLWMARRRTVGDDTRGVPVKRKRRKLTLESAALGFAF